MHTKVSQHRSIDNIGSHRRFILGIAMIFVVTMDWWFPPDTVKPLSLMSQFAFFSLLYFAVVLYK